MPVLFRGTPAMPAKRFWEFFTVNIRNRNTLASAYFVAVAQYFAAWCDETRALGNLAACRRRSTSPLISNSSERHVAQSRPSSSTWPRSACSSIGWSPGTGHSDSTRRTPCAGPKPQRQAKAKPPCSRRKRCASCSTPSTTNFAARAAGSGADRASWAIPSRASARPPLR